jgi:RHS repeat-associated protein
MLARSESGSGGTYTNHDYYFADGNGNITFMIDSTQSMVAKYRDDPFGNPISASGTYAYVNTYRFSSKQLQTAANVYLYYYGFRFYDPDLQRWVNRDPLGEPGFRVLRRRRGPIPRYRSPGPNAYQFTLNSPLVYVDRNGLTIQFAPDSPNSFIQHWRDCICMLATSPSGKNILTQAAQPNINITITATDSASTGGETGEANIDLNATDPLGVDAESRAELEGWGELPPNTVQGCATVLAHELGHALHPGEDPLGVDYDEDSPSFGRNVQTHENPVRSDFNLPARHAYHGKPLPD